MLGRSYPAAIEVRGSERRWARGLEEREGPQDFES
jgi:hypothetical protein